MAGLGRSGQLYLFVTGALAASGYYATVTKRPGRPVTTRLQPAVGPRETDVRCQVRGRWDRRRDVVVVAYPRACTRGRLAGRISMGLGLLGTGRGDDVGYRTLERG